MDERARRYGFNAFHCFDTDESADERRPFAAVETPRNASDAPPNIYPDQDGMPMLPALDSITMKMAEQKRLIRRYIIAKSSELDDAFEKRV